VVRINANQLRGKIDKLVKPFIFQIQENKILGQIQNQISTNATTQNLFCDWTQYQNIIYNLLSNAIKYCKPGGRIQICFTLDESERYLHTRIKNSAENQVPKSLLLKLNQALMSNSDGSSSALQDLSDESESDRLE